MARYQLQPAAVECTAKRHRHMSVAVPAHFQHRRLETRERKRGSKPFRHAAGVNYQIAIRRRRFRLGKIYAERSRQIRARQIDIDQRHLCPGNPAAQESDQRADHARPHHRNSIGRLRSCIPDRVERSLHIGGQHGTCRRHAIR